MNAAATAAILLASMVCAACPRPAPWDTEEEKAQVDGWARVAAGQEPHPYAAPAPPASSTTPLIPPGSVLASASPAAGTSPPASPPADRREFWREAARERGSVPAGNSAAEWARELDPWLASTDPELRDDLAYTILAGWIARGKLDDAALRELAAKWRADLALAGERDEGGVARDPGRVARDQGGVARDQDDVARDQDDVARDQDVVARSFAALLLASVVRRENRAPFLGDELARIRAAALDYATRETDVRGYEMPLGWVHATAHAADLLAALARGAALQPGDAAKMLAVIDAKAALPGAVWRAGEDLRLARVAAALVAREDFDAEAFEAWIARYETDWSALWTAPPLRAERLAELGNRRRVLAELAALLAENTTEARVVAARERVLQALRATG